MALAFFGSPTAQPARQGGGGCQQYTRKGVPEGGEGCQEYATPSCARTTTRSLGNPLLLLRRPIGKCLPKGKQKRKKCVYVGYGFNPNGRVYVRNRLGPHVAHLERAGYVSDEERFR